MIILCGIVVAALVIAGILYCASGFGGVMSIWSRNG